MIGWLTVKAEVLCGECTEVMILTDDWSEGMICWNCDDPSPVSWDVLHNVAERQNWQGWWFSTPNFTGINSVPYGWEVEHEEAEEQTQWSE